MKRALTGAKRTSRNVGEFLMFENSPSATFFWDASVLLKVWFADEEFPASGRLLLDESAPHYLTIEDAVTVGSLILDQLTGAQHWTV